MYGYICFFRETMLQALRGVLTPAGDKMTEPMKKQVFATLSSMLGHSEDVTRNAVAGCFGALVRWLSPDLLAVAFNDHLLCKFLLNISLSFIFALFH